MKQLTVAICQCQKFVDHKMTSEEFDFSKICRVCCLEGTMMSIFKVHISKKLMACAAIQVWQNDGLPSQICTKCIAKLHIAFQFKKQCEKSDARLRHYLINIEQIQENQQQTQIQHQQPSQISEQQQPQSQPQQQSEFVYVECTAPVENTMHEVRHYESMQNAQIHNHHSQLAYGQPINSLQQISGTYPIQSLHVPSVQFQTYNVPIQVPPTNHVLTLGPITSVATSAPLQPIITNHNQPQLAMQSLEPSLNEKKQHFHPSTKSALLKRPLISNSNLLKIPVRIKGEHDSNRPCQICGKEFSSATKLTRHMKTHSGEMPYKCKVCLKRFSHSGNFKVHMRMHTDERPYQCSMCDKACRQQQDLEKHMRTHTGERPHVCPVCSKAFSTSSNLIAHTRIHSGEKPYVCSICQKAFCQSNELTKHLRTHTGEKSHICQLCHKGFNGSSTLVVHMRSHTGERPYICNICNKGFTQSSCLQVHLKRHNNEKNFHCNICSRSFITQSDLREHQQTHNGGDKQFGCNICDKRYSRAHDLNKHAKTHM